MKFIVWCCFECFEVVDEGVNFFSRVNVFRGFHWLLCDVVVVVLFFLVSLGMLF